MSQRLGHLDDTHASLNAMLLQLAFVVPVVVTPIAALLGEFGGLLVMARRGMAIR